MAETVELPDPDSSSSAYEPSTGRFLTHREYAELLVRKAAAAASTSESDDGGETPARRRRRASSSAEFTGPLVPAQFKIPSDLLSSLKLLSFDSGETMSALVIKCLTSSESVPKCWLQKRAG